MAEKARWRRIVARLLAALALVFVVLQFFPAERTNPPVISEVEAPAAVQAILERSCYDCHSNETRWPWYSRVAPFSWWLADHVEHARRDLNFSVWPVYDFDAQEIEFVDIREEVESGGMPLRSYLLAHPSARLSEADRRVLVEWAGVEASTD
jgi:hypothetical protein